MIYTTYFANLKHLPASVEPVSIARFSPKGVKIRSCSKFFPPAELIRDYKAGKISDVQYSERYRNEVLSSLDAKTAYEALDGKALVCYEKTGDFCHRNLVAEWFRENGFNCDEYLAEKALSKPDEQLSLFDS